MNHECSLQGNFEKLEMLLNDLECQFDSTALTETWHNDNNPSFIADILPGYGAIQKNVHIKEDGGGVSQMQTAVDGGSGLVK